MSEHEVKPEITQFIKRLMSLDSSGKAQLKRSAGLSLAEARKGCLGLFYSLLPQGIPTYQQETYFALATLYPLAEAGKEGDFGSSLARIRIPKNAKGLDRRVIILLDADEAQLSFRLRQALHFLQSNSGHVNWEALLVDLLAWSHPNRFVQRRWAESYFSSIK